MPRKIRVPADKEANRQSQQLSRQRHREYVAGLEKRLNEMERRGVQATIEVQEAARAVAAKNEKLLALLALHGVSDDEINAFLTYPSPQSSLLQRGGAPCPSAHPHSGSRNGHPPWDAGQSVGEPRHSSMHQVPTPCYPRPATMEPRQSAEAGRSPAYAPSTMSDPVQSQSQCSNRNWNQDQSPLPVCVSVSTQSTPPPDTCLEPVSYTPPSPSYPPEEPRAIKTSRCGPRRDGGCGPQGVPCRQEVAKTATRAQTQSRDNTPQQPANTPPHDLSGQMITSCDAAASIIADMYHHGDIATARAKLACGTEGSCFISNLDLLELMESHGW